MFIQICIEWPWKRKVSLLFPMSFSPKADWAVQRGTAAADGSEDHRRTAFLHPQCTGATQKLHISDTIPVA